MARIAIDWTYGRPHTGAETDETRAEAAAERTIEAAGTTPQATEAEYRRQWLALDDETHMTGLALVWIAAQAAADVALTEGWHNPAGASCELRIA